MTRIPLITEDRIIFLQRRSRILRWTALALVIAWCVVFAIIYHTSRSSP